ncbi:MAG: polyphosphate polymerase domain-containing protein, partial [Bacteroidia bacterium]|nr:polyphosphate polymerase domain-containing protein [Bacteroidia bacterium]
MISANEHIFDTIQLEEMEQVKLMNRIDRKFWLHEAELPEILTSILPHYFALSINDQIQIRYATTYFDTPGNEMLRAHHNGKLNRFKIRRRTYVDSGISFLEVKFKNNKGRTIKKRISSDLDSTQFSMKDREFIQSCTPYQSEELHPGLWNRFTRITLINKALNERCTIDTDIRFQTEDRLISLPNLVIVEIKSE